MLVGKLDVPTSKAELPPLENRSVPHPPPASPTCIHTESQIDPWSKEHGCGMGYYTKSYRSTEWIKIHFYDERNTPKVKHWISKKIYCKVFSCTSLVKILDVAKFHLTLLQEPDPVHSPSVVVKEK